MYIIRILNYSTPCWVAGWEDGDPPRTLVVKNAQTFKSKNEAEDRIMQVRKTHPLKTISYEIEKANNF